MLSHPDPSLVQVAESGPSRELRCATVQRHTSKSLHCFALVICIPLKLYFVGVCLSPLRVFLSEPQSINFRPKVIVSKFPHVIMLEVQLHGSHACTSDV